jgi:hypothetical protein
MILSQVSGGQAAKHQAMPPSEAEPLDGLVSGGASLEQQGILSVRRGDGRKTSNRVAAAALEFVPDPKKLAVTFTLNGKLMQDANASLMIHNVFEQVSYATHIATLRPGDVIATGGPAGVGSARKPPIFLKAGDVAVCSYEGIGTLRNPIAGPDAR